jgi:hypothetical protein
LSKEKEKEKPLNFNIGKVTGSANVSVLIAYENSQREQSFLSQFKKQGSNVAKQKVQPTQGESKPTPSVITSKEQKLDTEEKPREKEKDELSNHSKDDHEDEVPEDQLPKKTLKSEVLRKSLKMNFEEFTFNTECRRCNYLEKMLQAQQSDLKVLQSQIECFMNGNFENPDKQEEKFDSESLLKEPQFNKIYADSNVIVDENSLLKPEEKKSNLNATTTSDKKKPAEKSTTNNQNKQPIDKKTTLRCGHICS